MLQVYIFMAVGGVPTVAGDHAITDVPGCSWFAFDGVHAISGDHVVADISGC
jgi:hypothetical protein